MTHRTPDANPLRSALALIARLQPLELVPQLRRLFVMHCLWLVLLTSPPEVDVFMVISSYAEIRHSINHIQIRGSPKGYKVLESCEVSSLID